MKRVFNLLVVDESGSMEIIRKQALVGINSGPLPDSALSDNGANIVLQRMTELCDLWGEILAARN